MQTGHEPVAQEELSSIVVTVKNESVHISQLLESLVIQASPLEIIVVDAFSDDHTLEVARGFSKKHPGLIHTYQFAGKRGAGRNFGVTKSSGRRIYFTDGDCVADSNWLASMKEGMRHSNVVAGKTITVGNQSYARLERVELFQRGMDVTYPSCNLGYERVLFEKLGGFDERFVTAEDIDLNMRAVLAGAKMDYNPSAVIYHNTRMSLLRFLIQAFWNGYGRKQLTEKHGNLWSRYQYRRMFSTQMSPLAYVRLMTALAGYFTRLVTTAGTEDRIRPEAS